MTRRNSALPGWLFPPAPRRQMTSVDFTSSVVMYVSVIVADDNCYRVRGQDGDGNVDDGFGSADTMWVIFKK